MEIRPYLMENPVMHYAWGAKGGDAFIPRLLKLSKWDETLPWAELWMGAHPKAPSHILTSHGKISLRDFINEQPETALGGEIIKTHGKELPFLLKVLSASEILSIQAHPNKQQAEILHSQDPEHYPDPNHKPELAIALDRLNALVGIKEKEELSSMLAKLPELENLIGNGNYNVDFRRKVFESLIKTAESRPQKIKNTVKKLKSRLGNKNKDLSYEEQLFLETAKKYPENDVGLLLIFILKHCFFEHTEGVFIPAGIPHAYIRGNIIECMANSDNVVRAGLTPKFKDAKTLLEITDYSNQPRIYTPPKNKKLFTYKVPAREFIVYRWEITKGENTCLENTSGPAILLLIKGAITINWQINKQLSVDSGNSVFIPGALEKWNILADQNSLVFVATVPC